MKTYLPKGYKLIVFLNGTQFLVKGDVHYHQYVTSSGSHYKWKKAKGKLWYTEDKILYAIDN